MIGGFGNRIHTETREENFRLFMRANRLVGIVVIWCAAMMTALYQPFIREWTRGRPELICHALTPLLMVFFFYINQSRQTLLSFKSAAALWKADRWKPVAAGLLNLTLNITFIKLFPEESKLDGVILSTILSFLLIQIPWESHVMFTAFFSPPQARCYWSYQLRAAGTALLLCGAAWGGARLIRADGIGGLILKGICAGVISTSLTLLFFRRDLGEMAHKLLARRRNAGAPETPAGTPQTR